MGYTNDEISEIIELEGFGYALSEYMSADSIEDESLAGMVRDLNKKMGEIETYLTEHPEENLAEIIEIEGFDYALADYINPDTIENETLAGMVRGYLKIREDIEAELGL